MIIVVTGNIGCGKSTVVDMLWRELWPISMFDFDKMVRAMYEEEDVKELLVDRFGTTNRSTISDIVFSSQEDMATLVSIFDGLTKLRMNRAFGEKRVILDIPLYFEHFASQYDHIEKTVICVSCDVDVQYQRVRVRNGFSDEKIASIMARQLPSSHKELMSDYVITNNGSLDELSAQVERIVQELEPE